MSGNLYCGENLSCTKRENDIEVYRLTDAVALVFSHAVSLFFTPNWRRYLYLVSAQAVKYNFANIRKFLEDAILKDATDTESSQSSSRG